MLESDKKLSELSKSDFNDNLKCNWFISETLCKIPNFT